MKDMELSVQDIKDLMSAMNKSNISSLKLELGDFELELESSKTVTVAAQPVGVNSHPVAASGDAELPEYDGSIVKSPIVGTFYAAPAPEKPPYVKVGSQVKQGDVLFIIESMKLMNEVLCEQDGVVSRILVENGQGVEYGQPILCIE